MQKAVTYGFDKRARSVTSYKPKGILLDVGCATGDFLQHMKQTYGWSVQGVEVSAYAAKLARERYGVDVFTGTLGEACFSENFFDAVTMWDVLEHLHDPSNELKEIYRILKPGGVLALRVPNAASFDARIFGSYWAGLDAPRHLYIFDKETLTHLLSKNGFEVISANSKNGSYLGVALSLRMWMVGKGVRASVRKMITSIMYHPVMRLGTAPIFYLYSLFDQSTQLTVAAVKKS